MSPNPLPSRVLFYIAIVTVVFFIGWYISISDSGSGLIYSIPTHTYLALAGVCFGLFVLLAALYNLKVLKLSTQVYSILALLVLLPAVLSLYIVCMRAYVDSCADRGGVLHHAAGRGKYECLDREGKEI